jgi:hypothetical protein
MWDQMFSRDVRWIECSRERGVCGIGRRRIVLSLWFGRRTRVDTYVLEKLMQVANATAPALDNEQMKYSLRSVILVAESQVYRCILLCLFNCFGEKSYGSERVVT